jgi:predicted GIY-YIG superfamily endonuclease
MDKQPAVYIVTNKRNGTLYTGVTSCLLKRVYQHGEGFISDFTKRYNCTKLVYYEVYDRMLDVIEREKLIKSKNRKNKLTLIESKNPQWKDLYDVIIK